MLVSSMAAVITFIPGKVCPARPLNCSCSLYSVDLTVRCLAEYDHQCKMFVCEEIANQELRLDNAHRHHFDMPIAQAAAISNFRQGQVAIHHSSLFGHVISVACTDGVADASGGLRRRKSRVHSGGRLSREASDSSIRSGPEGTSRKPVLSSPVQLGPSPPLSSLNGQVDTKGPPVVLQPPPQADPPHGHVHGGHDTYPSSFQMPSGLASVDPGK
jgi:hypothetical protein